MTAADAAARAGAPSPARPDPIADWLAAAPRLVLDGALATELERRGADLNDPLWSARVLLEQPGLIRQVHLDYFRAGADVATTASYQASFEGFARRGLSHQAAADLMRRAVTLAAEAREQFMQEPAAAGRRRPLVAASVGPYGAMRADGSEYRGDYGLDEGALMAFHRPRLQALATAGADLLACETIPCLAEARALARLMDELPAGSTRSGWISFSCRDGAHTSQGEHLGDCVAALDGFAGVAAIGVNCTAPQHIAPLVAAARARTAKPIVVYPNAGEAWDAVAKRWLPHAPGAHPPAFAEQARGWEAAGARLIGGCCRTGPADISALLRR
ncbi:MAG: homocysteine S-methyltransferase [Aquincola tertiaricarbonis]